MRDLARGTAVCVLLAGPTVLAFLTGGFRDEQRLLAALVAWSLVGLAALAAERPLPRAAAGRVALAGLTGLVAWTALSVTWAPLQGVALDDVQRSALYLGALIGAAAFLVPGRPARALEPALAAGATIVMLYGLSERLLPDLVELDRSVSAVGRLEQPITYWNAMGGVGAIGLTAVARLVADPTRPPWMRTAAAAAAAPLGAAVYLTFSRGGLVALSAGLLVLTLLLPQRRQLAAIALALPTAVLGALAMAPFPWVRSLEGSASTGQGLAALALIVLVAGAAAVLGGRPARLRGDAVRRGRSALALGTCLVVTLGVLVAVATETRPEVRTPATGATPSRLTSVDTNRYDYWRVALETFADAPLAGTGAAAFRVEWLQRRTVPESVLDAHSLVLETAAELGLVGLLALGLMGAGVAVAGRRTYRARPEEVAGAMAVAAAWAAHALLDWDWEMPALTLIAFLAAGVLIAAADRLDPAG